MVHIPLYYIPHRNIEGLLLAVVQNQQEGHKDVDELPVKTSYGIKPPVGAEEAPLHTPNWFGPDLMFWVRSGVNTEKADQNVGEILAGNSEDGPKPPDWSPFTSGHIPPPPPPK